MTIPSDVQTRIDELTAWFNDRKSTIITQITTLNSTYGRKIQLAPITFGNVPAAITGCPSWTASGLLAYFPADWSDLEIRLDEYAGPKGEGQVMGFKLTMNGSDYLREINYGSAPEWDESWRAAT